MKAYGGNKEEKETKEEKVKYFVKVLEILVF